MERSLLKELTKANIEAYVNRRREEFLKKLFWQQFFPLKYTTQLTWESLSGSGGSPVMADVIEYNSSAPLKTRRIVTMILSGYCVITLVAQKLQFFSKN